jgi:two-component system, chemotaxis family, CheB/CheR fusion protein
VSETLNYDNALNESGGSPFRRPFGESELFNHQQLAFAGITISPGDLAALTGFLNLLPVAVYTCEAPDGTITFYNEQAAALWGRKPRLGDTDDRFCGSFRLWQPDGSALPHNQTPMAVALHSGRHFRNEEVTIERPDGSRIHVLVNIDPIFDANGRIVGAVNAFSDVTSLKQAEEAQNRLAASLKSSVEALRAKETELALIAETTPVILTRCGRDLRYRFANRAAAALFGLKPEQMIGRPIYEVMSQEAFAVIKPRIEQVLGGEPVEFEARMPYNAAAGPRWVQANYLPEPDEQGQIVGWVASIVDITQRKKAEEALNQLTETLEERVEARTQQARQLASELLTAEQTVRQRVAQLLHDDLQQVLVALEMQLAVVKHRAGQPDSFDEIEETVSQAIDLARHLAVELSPPVLAGGSLTETLAWLAQHMAQTYQLQVTIEAGDGTAAVSEELRILVYHVVRELLFNVVKHAGVQEAQVTIRAGEDGFNITVRDDGVGFEPAVSENGGFGLRSAQERLRLFEGRVDIDSKPGGGTQATLFLPHFAVSPQPQRQSP